MGGVKMQDNTAFNKIAEKLKGAGGSFALNTNDSFTPLAFFTVARRVIKTVLGVCALIVQEVHSYPQ